MAAVPGGIQHRPAKIGVTALPETCSRRRHLARRPLPRRFVHYKKVTCDAPRVSSQRRRAMETGLRGKAILITGASQGMGKATAEAFAAEGARLAICARNQ